MIVLSNTVDSWSAARRLLAKSLAVGLLLACGMEFAPTPVSAYQESDSTQEVDSTQKPDSTGESRMDVLDSLESMRLTSKAFRIASERVRRSLVTIESFAGVSAVQGKIGGIRKQGEGNTTGILISQQGHIVTSTFNFVQRPPVITVITSDGTRHFAKMLGRDESRKLCLLKIDDVADIPLPQFVDPATLRLGQWVVSLGVGYGDTNPAMSIGIVSATNRIGGRCIQTDANISPANYGGPLIDIDGRIVGVCVPMHPQSQAIGAGVEWYDSGIGFAVPLFGKEKWLERLKEGETIYPAFLGIQAVSNPNGTGVVIDKVVPKSPAAQAGLARFERITQLNGEPVNDLMRLKQLLNRFEAGMKISVEVVTDPRTDLSDDEVAQRKKDGLPLTIPGGTRTVELKLSPPPASQKPNSLEPPKIR